MAWPELQSKARRRKSTCATHTLCCMSRSPVLRPGTGSSAPRVTCPDTKVIQGNKPKTVITLSSARSEEVSVIRASRLNGALCSHRRVFACALQMVLALCHMPCPCPSSSHPRDSSHITVSLSCPARSDCKQNSGTLGYHSSGPCAHRPCTLSVRLLARRVVVAS